jgi:sucrose phosphorylase
METEELKSRIRKRLTAVYGSFPLSESDFEGLLKAISGLKKQKAHIEYKWNEKDIILITYGDSIRKEKEKPLSTLHNFMKEYFGDIINYVHILPFFPYSSDDGFSVIDYYRVNPELGSWEDVENIGKNHRLMFDLVINHVSQHSEWFQNYLKGISPGDGYFIEVDPGTDLSLIVRPRSLPLLSAFNTVRGEKHLWTTFSTDQIDLNFSKPEVLMEIVKVFLFYLSKGCRIIRLDAIAFLWKKIGTSCLHQPQTHEVVKLFRDIADFINQGIIILTETNVPNRENLSYFGNGDEANMVYQFSLPPLLLHALYYGDSSYLSDWSSSAERLSENCTFFNFTASHDGIGVRPLEGILPKEEIDSLALAMKKAGGYISTKRNKDGTDSPYELNIAYLDAMKNSCRGTDKYQIQRFICSQALMMSFRGIPAFYIHSLLGTTNHYKGVEMTGMPRSINRRKWEAEELKAALGRDTDHARILKELLRIIKIRKQEKAFHPDSPQEVIRENSKIFVLCRGPQKNLVVVANLSEECIELSVPGKTYLGSMRTDILSAEPVDGPILKMSPYQVRWLRK